MWCEPGRHALTKHGVDPWLGRYPAVSSLSEISWSQWFSFFPSYAKVVFLHGFQGQAWLQVWWCISSHVLLQVSAWLDVKGCLSKVPISLQADTVRRFINHMISDYCLTLFGVWWLFHVPCFLRSIHRPIDFQPPFGFSGLNNTLIKGWHVEKVPQQPLRILDRWAGRIRGMDPVVLSVGYLSGQAPSCIAIFWVCMSLLEINWKDFLESKLSCFLSCKEGRNIVKEGEEAGSNILYVPKINATVYRFIFEGPLHDLYVQTVQTELPCGPLEKKLGCRGAPSGGRVATQCRMLDSSMRFEEIRTGSKRSRVSSINESMNLIASDICSSWGLVMYWNSSAEDTLLPSVLGGNHHCPLVNTPLLKHSRFSAHQWQIGLNLPILYDALMLKQIQETGSMQVACIASASHDIRITEKQWGHFKLFRDLALGLLPLQMLEADTSHAMHFVYISLIQISMPPETLAGPPFGHFFANPFWIMAWNNKSVSGWFSLQHNCCSGHVRSGHATSTRRAISCRQDYRAASILPGTRTRHWDPSIFFSSTSHKTKFNSHTWPFFPDVKSEVRLETYDERRIRSLLALIVV